MSRYPYEQYCALCSTMDVTPVEETELTRVEQLVADAVVEHEKKFPNASDHTAYGQLGLDDDLHYFLIQKIGKQASAGIINRDMYDWLRRKE